MEEDDKEEEKKDEEESTQEKLRSLARSCPRLPDLLLRLLHAPLHLAGDHGVRLRQVDLLPRRGLDSPCLVGCFCTGKRGVEGSAPLAYFPGSCTHRRLVLLTHPRCQRACGDPEPRPCRLFLPLLPSPRQYRQGEARCHPDPLRPPYFSLLRLALRIVAVPGGDARGPRHARPERDHLDDGKSKLLGRVPRLSPYPVGDPDRPPPFADPARCDDHPSVVQLRDGDARQPGRDKGRSSRRLHRPPHRVGDLPTDRAATKEPGLADRAPPRPCLHLPRRGPIRPPQLGRRPLRG